MNKFKSYQVPRGRIHAKEDALYDYLCTVKRFASDKKTKLPITCKHYIRMLAKQGYGPDLKKQGGRG